MVTAAATKRVLLIVLAMMFMAGVCLDGAFAAEKEWTILVFINGDNNLEGAGIDDINEMEKVGSTDDVNIVVEIDRTSGYDYSNGDWTTTRRYYITKDSDPYKINSELIRDLGEVDTGDYNSLVDFARWGMAEYPAQRLLLVIWNHGQGWKKKAEEPVFKGISYDDTSGNHMTTQDIEKALMEVVALRGGQKIDVLGMDACLMQMVEVSYEFRQYADITVASEEVEPGDGWPYDDFLAPLVADPDMDSAAVAKLIVDKYIESYSGGSAGNQAVTQSAIDCRKLDGLVASIDTLAAALMSNIKQIGRIKDCMNKTQSYYYSDYKDLGDFITKVSATFKDGALAEASQAVNARLAEAVIANGTNGSSQKASTGLSIYIPSKYQYKSKYEKLAFTGACRWDEFLKASFDPPVPILAIKKLKVIDAGEDGKVSPGESLSFEMTVENTGGAASNGAVVKLSCTDEFVTVTDDSLVLGEVPKKQKVVFNGLGAEVSESCPANRRFTLVVGLEDDGVKVGEDTVDVMVRKPFSVTSNLLLIVPNTHDKATSFYSSALDSLEIAYDLWDVDYEGTIAKGTLIKYLGGTAIRVCPDNNGEGKIGPDEQEELAGFLDQGGSLLLSGQDIGYGLNNTQFYRDYLHAKYVQDNVGHYDIAGVDGSPLASLSFRIAGGDGANNQRWPDELDPIAPAVAVLKYIPGGKPVRYPPSEVKPGTGRSRGISSSGSAGIFLEKNEYKVLYLGFGFEGVADKDSRAALMQTALGLLSSSFQKKMETLLSMEQFRQEFGAASLKVSRSIIAEVMKDLDQNSLEKLDSLILFLSGLSPKERKPFRPVMLVIRERMMSSTLSDESPLVEDMKNRVELINELSQ